MIIDPYTWHTFVVKEKTIVAAETVALRMTRPASYTFRAGQYAVVRVTAPNGQQYMRQFSFSSGPAESDLELLVQHQLGGEVSTWIHDHLTASDQLELSQPFGSFTLDKHIRRPHLLIAGRIGIAPYISMVRDRHPRNTSILYSVRNPEQVIYPDLLSRVATTIIHTEVSPRISIEDLRPLLETDPVVYVCGSKQFVEAICTLLGQCNMDSRDIKRELFTLQ